MTKHIAILRGDGIGPEIVAETANTAILIQNSRKTFAVKPMRYCLVQSVLLNTTISTVHCALSAACWPSVKT